MCPNRLQISESSSKIVLDSVMWRGRFSRWSFGDGGRNFAMTVVNKKIEHVTCQWEKKNEKIEDRDQIVYHITSDIETIDSVRLSFFLEMRQTYDCFLNNWYSSHMHFQLLCGYTIGNHDEFSFESGLSSNYDSDEVSMSMRRYWWFELSQSTARSEMLFIRHDLYTRNDRSVTEFHCPVDEIDVDYADLRRMQRELKIWIRSVISLLRWKLMRRSIIRTYIK